MIVRTKVTCQQRGFVTEFFLKRLCKSSLRQQPTFGDTTTGFPAKWRLRNERRNSILMTCHYPDLGSVSDWLNQISHLARSIRSTTPIWVVTRYQYGIFALFQTSFGGETSGRVSKCRLFSEATVKGASFFVINIGVTHNDPNNCWEEGYHPSTKKNVRAREN